MTEHDETVKQIAENLNSRGFIDVKVNSFSPHCIMCEASGSGMTPAWMSMACEEDEEIWIEKMEG